MDLYIVKCVTLAYYNDIIVQYTQRGKGVVENYNRLLFHITLQTIYIFLSLFQASINFSDNSPKMT